MYAPDADVTVESRIVEFPDRPDARLRRALRKLDAALAHQAEAVRNLRTELGALSTAVQGLSSSLQGYQAELGRTAAAATQAHAEAKRLDATADALMAACGSH